MTDLQVMIATPSYDGQVVPQFAESLKATLALLKERGIAATWEVWSGCCYLPIARNKLVKKFLESTAEELIFIDADIEWDPEDVLRLLAWPVEMVAGVYRVKEFEDRYPLWLKTDSSGRPAYNFSELLEAYMVPTGFLRISRSVFEAMQRHCGEALEVDEYNDRQKKIGGYLNFFDTEKRGRQWIGEDVNFCQRWTLEMSRKLYVDPQIKLTHWGVWPSGHPRAFPSDYHDYLSRLPGGAGDPGYQGSDIPGYLSKAEAQWLFARAKSWASIAEVGSFCGRSAHALLSGQLRGKVYCVDSWLPMDWHDVINGTGVPDDEDTAERRFLAFLENTAMFPNRVVYRMDSLHAAKQFDSGAIDMVWIDADHSYEGCRSDIEAWLPKTRYLICGHDYEEWGWPGVKKAVDELFGDRVCRGPGSIWYVVL